MDYKYMFNGNVDVNQIGDLRLSVGWNAMVESYKQSLLNSYFYICCYDEDKLIGFLDVVSNGVTDAYIQDLIVNPNYQGKEIGSNLMTIAIEKLKHDNIYAISVLFDESLISFYKKFNFSMMLGGQIINE